MEVGKLERRALRRAAKQRRPVIRDGKLAHLGYAVARHGRRVALAFDVRRSDGGGAEGRVMVEEFRSTEGARVAIDWLGEMMRVAPSTEHPAPKFADAVRTARSLCEPPREVAS